MNKPGLKETPQDITPDNKAEGLPSVNQEADEYNLDVIVDYDGKIDPFFLEKKNPAYAYRFLRAEHKNISIKTGNILMQKGGWQIVPRKHLLKTLEIKESQISPDGFYRVGDTVLAFMPMHLYEQKEKYKIKQANEPINAIERMIKKGDPSEGGKDIHKSMKGIQTQEGLRM